MNSTIPTTSREPAGGDVPLRALLGFATCLLLLSGLFWRSISDLAHLAGANELYSHVFLMPFVAGYLIWTRKDSLSPVPVRSSPVLGTLCLGLALVPVIWLWVSRRGGMGNLAAEDALFLSMAGFLGFALVGAFYFFGRQWLWAAAMPLGLLLFLMPLPKSAERGIEVFFQHTSAEAAAAFFSLAGIPFVREGLVFNLPTITLEVAPECSGIRSSLVLLITSLVAGCLFLRTTWKRAALTLAVVPLGIVRNGLRIFVIGWLCVRVDPSMIHSWVHRQGGPVFFALSLVPFFGLLLWLRKSERVEASVPIAEKTRGTTCQTDPV